jgi:hypothetical protein
MTNDSFLGICELWQKGSDEPPRFTPEELQNRMGRFERTIRRRNLREYIAAALVTGIFGYYGWRFPTLLLRIGCGLIVAGTAYVVYQLHHRAAARSAPADMGLRNCIDFQRSELKRQRDALNAVWSWYLLPFLPGMGVFLLGLFQFTIQVARAAGRPFHMGAAVAAFGLVSGGVAIVFLAIWQLNRWGAKNLQKEIDDLDELTRDSA